MIEKSGAKKAGIVKTFNVVVATAAEVAGSRLGMSPLTSHGAVNGRENA